MCGLSFCHTMCVAPLYLGHYVGTIIDNNDIWLKQLFLGELCGTNYLQGNCVE